MNIRRKIAAVLVIAALLQSVSLGATKDRVPHLPETPCNYSDPKLASFYNSNPVRRLDNTPSSDPVTDAGATLGRVLFYDTRLSANNTVSCASCHRQDHAFSDPKRFSVGFAGKQTDRHAMPLVDLRYYSRGQFFWDERAKSLEEQVLMPIQNGREMGQNLTTLTNIVTADAIYPALYEKAFGDAAVTPERTASALAQFVRSLVSDHSKYDEGLAKTGRIDAEFPNFSAVENRGKSVFLTRCANCHLPPGQGVIFSTQAPENTGLDGDAKVTDLGLADVTFNRFQAGKFKSPSLRNIEYTGPYMHDGRFTTLEEVVEHYSSGVKLHPNLDPRLGGPPGRLRMSPAEKASLVAFLKTLSDPQFMHDPKFSDPFDPKALAETRVPQGQRIALTKAGEGSNR